jgi:hypothetical protein
MKKLILSILTVALGVGMSAQSQVDEIPADLNSGTTQEFQQNATHTPVDSDVNMKVLPFFTEDFSNGFAGSNGVGPFTFSDSGTSDIWMLMDGTSTPAGEFSEFAGPLASTTADNGWVIFDCDFYNTPIASGVEDVQGFLTSPSIDCSARSSVIVEWQQYFRYCCFQASPMTLEVSNDNGTSWISFPAYGSFIESANEFSGDITTVVDVSCAAAGQADVMIRWAYNSEFAAGYSHYFWGIDDIVVSEGDIANDLRINQVANGDVFNIYEYQVTPIQQAITVADGGLLVAAMYENIGSADQNNVTVTAEILDASGTVVSTTVSDPFTIPSKGNALTCPALEDTMFMQTGWVPTETGFYSVTMTIASDQTDEVADDNVMMKSFSYTSTTMGHDDFNAYDIEYRPGDTDSGSPAFGNAGMGNFFTVPNDGSNATGLTVRFGPNCGSEFEISARLYELAGPGDLNDGATWATSADYEIEPGDVAATIAGAGEVFIEFDDEWPLTPGFFYFVAVTLEEESDDELTVVGVSSSDTDFSSRAIALSGAGDYVWFTDPGTPAVRLVMDGDVLSVDDFNQIEGVGLQQNMPNPFSDETTISYNLTTAKSMAFEVTDVTGKVVMSENFGTQAIGAHQIQLDAERFESGVYYYSLISGTERITKKMVVSK